MATRGSSPTTPINPNQISARSILRDPKNSLGSKFDPKARYSLLNKRHDSDLIHTRLSHDGWVVVLDDVPGDGNMDSFMLISKVE